MALVVLSTKAVGVPEAALSLAVLIPEETAPRAGPEPPRVPLALVALHAEASPDRVERLMAPQGPGRAGRGGGHDRGDDDGGPPDGAGTGDVGSDVGGDFLDYFHLEWLLSLPDPPESDTEWLCLREAIYHEARGEDVVGQFAVAEVILNRVDSRRYPDTICAVVNQNIHRPNACQFSYACDGRPVTLNDRRAIAIAGRVARTAIDAFDRQLTGGATHYHAVRVSPHWSVAMERTARYGAHVFYRDRPRRRSLP